MTSNQDILMKISVWSSGFYELQWDLWADREQTHRTSPRSDDLPLALPKLSGFANIDVRRKKDFMKFIITSPFPVITGLLFLSPFPLGMAC